MKLLVISLAGIGDTVFATPLFRTLREDVPQPDVWTFNAFVIVSGRRLRP